ncbi:DUF4394 domain-containing protein [Hymenobacter sp. H14-R3]|uniref:DUF4394 domain-containing protein n=1 Tax=Hymenobacter sp. H14-R3 TaxID=3046308 RepID=UPI0024BA49DC|nr:DUF4394 domain-containing protein [Hymenobacter sp. H14-R3]MDJ0365090.1 DUF4394 domain-containing protein [Hymenobacter sp. H14-R3]
MRALSTFDFGAATRRGLALGLLLAGATALPAAAQTVYGLSVATTGAVSLVTFSATAPGTFTATLPVTGLTAGQTLVGLDTRPNTGQLFALGYNPTGTQSQLYSLNATTGALTAVGAALTTLNLGTTTNRIGFDFNPTVDRIRVTGSNNTNYRLNPNNGALAFTDGNLAYNPGNPTATPVVPADANAGQTPVIGSVAYGNSYIGATTTVLYDIDEAKSLYTVQNPPNDGVLNSRTALTVNTATALATDLDIYFNPTTSANAAYLTIATGTAAAATTQLYTLDFITGANMVAVGAVGPAGTLVTDIAFAIARPATLPAITGQLAYALAGTNLLTFDTALPTAIRTSTGITGVDAAQTLVGMDVRPLNNALYALGYNATAAAGVANSQIYTINAVTGVASAIGTAIRLELGTGNVGFDFNPTVDRIRVVGTNRTNYRLNPITGALAFTDGVVAYTAGTNTPTIGTVAYTNSFSGTTATTLYNYDQVLNLLNTQATTNPPADGQLTTVGASGITVNAATPTVSLDIYSTVAGTNTAYLVASTGTSANTSLYTVNLTTGAATLVGAIGNGIAARDIAIAAATGVVTSSRATELATSFTLYPNPAASTTSLSFGLPRAARVELIVSDALGRTVDKVDAGQLAAGPQTLRWSRHGQAAGLYFFRLSFDGQAAGTRQVALTE